MSTIDTKHPSLEEYEPRWEKMQDTLSEQDVIKAAAEKYLPKTSGMRGTIEGDARYKDYVMRARWYGIVRKALTGILGMLFEKDPTGASEDIVTKTGQNNVELTRDVARDVTSFGRSVLVVDAPKKPGTGQQPFIVRYHPKCLINWKVDEDNDMSLNLAVLQEQWPDPDNEDEFAHEMVDRYRVYRKREGKVSVTVYDEKENVVEDERPLKTPTMPVFVIGSIGVDPACDPVPLLPVADCAISIYQISADLRQDLYTSGQKQPYMKGVSQEQYDMNIRLGWGAGGIWSLGSEGEVGLVESNGSAYSNAASERGHEFDQAASYAVEMTQNSGSNKSGRALEIESAAQHANIYTMADSISQGVNMAFEMRAMWASQPIPEPFAIRTEFTSEEAADQIINAMNTAINSRNLPRSLLFEAMRRAGYTSKTDTELDQEIENDAIGLMLPQFVAPRSAPPAIEPPVVVAPDEGGPA